MNEMWLRLDQGYYYYPEYDVPYQPPQPPANPIAHANESKCDVDATEVD